MTLKKCFSRGVLALLLCTAVFLAACGGLGQTTTPADAEEAGDNLTPVIGAKTLEDGRKVGGSAKAGIGETMTNVFFSFSVNRAELTDNYEGEMAERGFLFLVAEITVTNTFDETLPMWASDFLVQWGDGDDDYGYPLVHFAETQMEDEFNLEVGADVTADVVFEVPLQEGGNEYNISYLEYYEDDVEGNMFYVMFNLSAA